MMEFLQTPLILFLAFVAPIWIISHYVTKWRTAKILRRRTRRCCRNCGN